MRICMSTYKCKYCGKFYKRKGEIKNCDKCETEMSEIFKKVSNKYSEAIKGLVDR